jgi:hypothetical protein
MVKAKQFWVSDVVGGSNFLEASSQVNITKFVVAKFMLRLFVPSLTSKKLSGLSILVTRKTIT